jgi:hypothetical protein
MSLKGQIPQLHRGLANGRNREGFRMPAGRDLSGGRGAGVRKPPRKEPAGPGGRSAVYGDLIGP